MKVTEKFVQIGVASMRTPTGGFLPPFPIYAKIKTPKREGGLTEKEEDLMHDLGGLFFDKYEEKRTAAE